jgi:aspartate-semialdehyde dehydrogenase
LRDWYERILAAKQDLALLMTLEQGKPLAESLGEIDYAASFVEWFAEEAKRANVEGVTSHLPNAETFVRREPLGVAGIVTPWNFPAAMLTRKAAAALAAGCTVVAHPSSETPLSALALAELGERAGIPAGVFNIITGSAQAIVGKFCEDRRVRVLSFTGSTEIGRLIAAQCAPTMKRLVMELGGHAPLIVFADADIARAVEIAIAAKFATSGQDCLAANRIYVERPVYEAFARAFAKRIAALKVGNGLAPGIDIGPLMHERARWTSRCAMPRRKARSCSPAASALHKEVCSSSPPCWPMCPTTRWSCARRLSVRSRPWRPSTAKRRWSPAPTIRSMVWSPMS